jgi:hypothetical protein
MLPRCTTQAENQPATSRQHRTKRRGNRRLPEHGLGVGFGRAVLRGVGPHGREDQSRLGVGAPAPAWPVPKLFGTSHGVGRRGYRPHWHIWMCASAEVLARCHSAPWLGSRCLRHQLAAAESDVIPAALPAEILTRLIRGFSFSELLSFSLSLSFVRLLIT